MSISLGHLIINLHIIRELAWHNGTKCKPSLVQLRIEGKVYKSHLLISNIEVPTRANRQILGAGDACEMSFFSCTETHNSFSRSSDNVGSNFSINNDFVTFMLTKKSLTSPNVNILRQGVLAISGIGSKLRFSCISELSQGYLKDICSTIDGGRRRR